MIKFNHIPVLLDEVIEGLTIKPDGRYLDCTLGGAGHSYKILTSLSEKGQLFGVDKDGDAINFCREKLKEFSNVTLINEDFKALNLIGGFDGILIDLGVSSYQIDTADRGFSFLKEARLDMRMDKTQKLDAYNVVNFYPKEKLLKILYEFGEERYASQIVKNIVQKRQTAPIETTLELNEIIENSLPLKYRLKGAGKKTFMAIRIEVNKELEALSEAIVKFISMLNKGGRLVIITFHSLEDRIVKQTFNRQAAGCICPPKTPICICGHKPFVKIIAKKPLVPSLKEQDFNPRSKSAKLRIVEKL